MAKKKRNTATARCELCPQFSHSRRFALPRAVAPFVAPLFLSYLFAKTQTLNQKPRPLPGVKLAGAWEVRSAPRRIAPRHNSRLLLRHWWALLASLLIRRLAKPNVHRARSPNISLYPSSPS
jgi:hypothetical protein